MRLKSGALGLLILAMVVSPAAAVVGMDAINESADAAHNPYIDTDVTKAEHEMGWEATWYENDNGERDALPADVNSTATNPERFVASDVNFSQAGEFPRKSAETGNNDASALDASEWTTDASNTAGSGSVSDVTTAPGVDAVQVSTSSQTSGDRFIADYSNVSITSDAPKRSLQLILDVNTLESGTTVTVTVNDTDGDYVAATINPSEDASTGQTIANSTGEGYVFQQQVGEMGVQGTGDGTMDEIQTVSVTVADGNANVDFAAINAEKLGEWDLGDRKADWDNDGNNETQAVHNVNESGTLEVTDVDTMGPAFDDATIHDLTIPMQFWSSMQPEEPDYERWNVSYESADEFASYDTRLNDYRRIHLPSAYDLSYANGEFRDSVEVPDGRYQTVEYATGVGTTNFSDVSYTDATSSYSSLDSDVTLATGISGGDEVAVHYDYVVTSEEAESLMATSGGGAPMAGSGGGIFGGLWGTIAGIGGSVLVFLGLKKKAGPRGS